MGDKPKDPKNGSKPKDAEADEASTETPTVSPITSTALRRPWVDPPGPY